MPKNQDNWFKSKEKPETKAIPKKAKLVKPGKAKTAKHVSFFGKAINKLSSWKKAWNKKLIAIRAARYDKERSKFIKVSAHILAGIAYPFTNGFIHRTYKKITAKPLVTKLIYTLLLLLIFRVAASITVPGITVKPEFKEQVSSGSGFFGIMDIMGGGGIRSFSLVTLGLGPFINASIIMQFLTTEAVPPLYRLSRSGPAGKRKINVITRVITFGFAVIQVVTFLQTLGSSALTFDARIDFWWFKYIVIPSVLIAGSFFSLYIGESITNRGVGNGTSLIIFSGIAANLPVQAKAAWSEIVKANPGESSFIGVLNFIIYVGVFLIILFIITYLYIAERRIPIQQTGSGLQMDRSQMSHLPIKLNPAGVMPIIFAMSITILPYQFASLAGHQNEARQWIQENLQLTKPIGLGIFVGLTFLFTLGMSYVTFNPATTADGFKKNGTFIPGIRPGEETEMYLWGVVRRLALFSSIYLSLIAATQFVEQIVGLSSRITIGGTSMIILVSVAIETINQLKARDKTQKLAKARINTISKQKENAMENGGGLLW